MATPQEHVPLTVVLPPEQFEALARRVADALRNDRDDGFLDVRGAAEYLSTTPKAIYALVGRGRLPHYRKGGRLLFDRAELREDVKRGD
jgi:excisionase family DNA binding protein